jgi:hypothetical protein
MPIVYRYVPAEAVEAVSSGVELMISKRAFHTPRLSRAVTKKAIVPFSEQALPVYHLGLSDIVGDSDIKSSVQTGWRYILKQDDEVLAHAETIIDPNGKHLFAGTNEGPLIEGTTKAIKAVEGQKEIIKGNFEVRLLFIPAIYVAALWLTDKEGKVDFAVPIEPTPAPLTPNKLITLKELLSIVQDKAKSALASYQDKEALGG